MNVTCPSCTTVYRVDPAKVPEAGVRARCKVCSGIFPVTRLGTPAAAVKPPEAPRLSQAPPARPMPAPAPAPVTAAPPQPPVPAEPPAPPAAPPVHRPTVAPPALPGGAPRPTAPRQFPPGGPAAPKSPMPPPPAVRPTAQSSHPPVAPTRPVPADQSVIPTPPRPAPGLRMPAGMGSSPPAATPVRQVPVPTPAAPRTPAAPGRPVNPFLSQDPAQKARRLARALISDLVVYYPDRRKEGLANGTLKTLFQEEIQKSWEEYNEQVGKELAESTPYFTEALNEILASGQKVF